MTLSFMTCFIRKLCSLEYETGRSGLGSVEEVFTSISEITWLPEWDVPYHPLIMLQLVELDHSVLTVSEEFM